MRIGNRFLDRILLLTYSKKIKWKCNIEKRCIRYRGTSINHIFVISETENTIYVVFNQKNILTTESEWEQIRVEEDILKIFKNEIKKIMFNKNIVEHGNYFVDKTTGEILYEGVS
jgi:hypothetical protein